MGGPFVDADNVASHPLRCGIERSDGGRFFVVGEGMPLALSTKPNASSGRTALFRFVARSVVPTYGESSATDNGRSGVLKLLRHIEDDLDSAFNRFGTPLTHASNHALTGVVPASEPRNLRQMSAVALIAKMAL